MCLGMKESEGLYSSGEGNMNGKPWEKSGTLNGEISGSGEQAKFGFPVTTIIAYRANFEKSYLTQF